jgi:thiol-disulfide isomerase/thioredoxin
MNLNIKIIIMLLINLLLIANSGFSQSILGTLINSSNKLIYLRAFNGLKNYTISSNTIDANGNFNLSYSPNDYGVGALQIEGEKPFIVILPGEDIQLTGNSFNEPNTIHISKGKQNQSFERYAQEQPKREQALSAWGYLENVYTLDSFFAKQTKPIAAIQQEEDRLNKEEKQFLVSLPANSYVHWFLPMRKLVSSVSVVAQYRTKEIPATIAAFRALDYTDPRLYKSGLFKDAIDNHFWLLENCGKPLDSVFIEMKISIDAMMSNLIKDEKKLNEVTDYLFDLLERHSLFQASEYLALKVLNEVSCTLNNDLAKQLETYRAMKKGNIAPDIVFHTEDKKGPQKLSDLKSQYTVVVFGASWCHKCTEEIPAIAKKYTKWKEQGVEVVFVSLDENKESFQQFTKDFAFPSTCDYKKWEGENVKNYYVFGTPTIFLLDNKREILLRPNSVQQMDTWVDWYLIQGNMSKPK